jgi:hypothetical protein
MIQYGVSFDVCFAVACVAASVAASLVLNMIQHDACSAVVRLLRHEEHASSHASLQASSHLQAPPPRLEAAAGFCRKGKSRIQPQ